MANTESSLCSSSTEKLRLVDLKLPALEDQNVNTQVQKTHYRDHLIVLRQPLLVSICHILKPATSFLDSLLLVNEVFKYNNGIKPPHFSEFNSTLSELNSLLGGGSWNVSSILEVKLFYLKRFLDWSELTLGICISKVREWEIDIRNCYEEKIQQKSDEFVRMILFDACFIIEHFRSYNAEQGKRRDPILNEWLLADVAKDLSLLENQLPFFVLERVYNLATHSNRDFLHITFNYFKRLNRQGIRPESVSVKHLTDLQRKFYLSAEEIFLERSEPGNILERLHSASELVEAGVEFKVDKENTCFLELKYVNGVLTMPHINIFDETEIFFRNIVAFEQCHYPFEAYIIDYLIVLDFLINTKRDVDILIHKGIITTLLGDSNEVAIVINRLCTGVIQRNMNLEYISICDQLNAFYDKPINTPMKVAISVAAILLIILTLIQTICSIYPLVKGS